MKVLHVIPSLSGLRGGPTFVVKALASQQARAGVEVHVVTTDDDDLGRQSVPLDRPTMSDGAIYWYFRRNTRTYSSSLGLTAWLLRHTAQFDLVHIHSVFTYPATVAAAIARRQSVPYVVRPLGVLNSFGLRSGRAWAKRLSIHLIESEILHRAAAVQFSSAAERDESAAVCRMAKTAVIPNPVNLAPPARRGLFRARYPSIGDRPMVLFVGRLSPVKGVELLLEAFRRVRERSRAVLVIAGSGDAAYERTLHNRAHELAIADDVIWPGFLGRPAKAEALADSDVFVAPSHSESFGLAAVEALAAGVPTVITEGVGIADEVSASGAAIVTRVDDAGAIAQGVERILLDSSLAEGLAGRAVALVRALYRPEAVASQVLSLYCEVGCRL
jgi:glycosyltransferase involved in cell wall biosynthesis